MIYSIEKSPLSVFICEVKLLSIKPLSRLVHDASVDLDLAQRLHTGVSSCLLGGGEGGGGSGKSTAASIAQAAEWPNNTAGW